MLQYTTMGKSLPKVELKSDMCAVCGQRIEAPIEEGKEAERTYRLTCGHLYPSYNYKHLTCECSVVSIAF